MSTDESPSNSSSLLSSFSAAASAAATRAAYSADRVHCGRPASPTPAPFAWRGSGTTFPVLTLARYQCRRHDSVVRAPPGMERPTSSKLRPELTPSNRNARAAALLSHWTRPPPVVPLSVCSLCTAGSSCAAGLDELLGRLPHILQLQYQCAPHLTSPDHWHEKQSEPVRAARISEAGDTPRVPLFSSARDAQHASTHLEALAPHAQARFCKSQVQL